MLIEDFHVSPRDRDPDFLDCLSLIAVYLYGEDEFLSIQGWTALAQFPDE